MNAFMIGERVWWKHTETNTRRGTIRVADQDIGVQPDDEPGLLYLDAGQLHRVIPAEDGVYSGISDIDYHADHTSLSSSGARALLPPNCPAIFDYERHQPPNPKPEYDFGHLAHKLVLGEGSEIVEVKAKDWRTNDAKAARDEAWAAGKVPALSAQVAKAHKMADAVMEHPVARALFQADGQAELSGYSRDPETGVRLRFRPDWLCQLRGRIICVDYKTSTSAHPGHFARQAATLGYFQQHPWYVDGLAAVEVADDAPFVFVTQSKTPPYPVSVIQLAGDDVDLGRRRNRQAIDIFVKCVANAEWPAYGHGISVAPLPKWVHYDEQVPTDE